jgi:hypothetical protein
LVVLFQIEKGVDVPTPLQRHVEILKGLSLAHLRERYVEIFGERLRTGNKAWIIKRLAWRLQALAEGGLSERARQRATELAHEANIRVSLPYKRSAKPAQEQPSQRTDPRLPPPGSVLARFYKGSTIQVRVLLHGFEFDGTVYPSLSAAAKAITGDHCNGFLFFRLGQGGAS